MHSEHSSGSNRTTRSPLTHHSSQALLRWPTAKAPVMNRTRSALECSPAPFRRGRTRGSSRHLMPWTRTAMAPLTSRSCGWRWPSAITPSPPEPSASCCAPSPRKLPASVKQLLVPLLLCVYVLPFNRIVLRIHSRFDLNAHRTYTRVFIPLCLGRTSLLGHHFFGVFGCMQEQSVPCIPVKRLGLTFC